MSERQSWTLDVSSEGHLVTLKEDRLSSVEATVSRLDPDTGTIQPLPWRDDISQFAFLGLSGDGNWIAYSSGDLYAPILIREVSRADASPVVLQTEMFSGRYRLSEDGSSVHYSAGAGSGRPPAVFSRPTDGSGPGERAFEDTPVLMHDRSSDGRYWALSDPGRDRDSGFAGLRFVDKQSETTVTVDSTILVQFDSGRFSPDMQYFAFDGMTSTEPLGSYVIRTDGGGPWRVGDVGDPFWSPDGGSIYLTQADRLVEVELDFSRGVRAVANSRTVYQAPGLVNSDIFPDGSLLIITGTSGDVDAASFRMILDWGQRLNELAPGK